MTEGEDQFSCSLDERDVCRLREMPAGLGLSPHGVLTAWPQEWELEAEVVAERSLHIGSGWSCSQQAPPIPGFPWKNSRALHRPKIWWLLQYCFFLRVSFSSSATHGTPWLCSAPGFCSCSWRPAAPDEPAEFRQTDFPHASGERSALPLFSQ